MALKSNYLPKEGNLKTVRGKTRLATSEKKIGFHFSLVKTRRMKLVSNILFPVVQVSMAPCERKKKISIFFTSLLPIE